MCASNPTSVVPGFGFAELVQSLVQEAHELGLRLVLKVQVNHACGLDLRFTSMPTVDEVDKSVMVCLRGISLPGRRRTVEH